MPKFTIEESQSAFHPPYRELTFSEVEQGYCFTISEDHKQVYSSSIYKDRDDCCERGYHCLNTMHQEKPLLLEKNLPGHYKVKLASTKGKSTNNG